MWSVDRLGRLAEKNSHREKKRDGCKGHLKRERYCLQRTTHDRHGVHIYAFVVWNINILSSGTFVLYWCEDEFPEATQPAVELPLSGGQLLEGRHKTLDVLVCQDGAALPAAAHTADVAHLHTSTGKHWTLCDTNHPSLTLDWLMQTSRQTGSRVGLTV